MTNHTPQQFQAAVRIELRRRWAAIRTPADLAAFYRDCGWSTNEAALLVRGGWDALQTHRDGAGIVELIKGCRRALKARGVEVTDGRIGSFEYCFGGRGRGKREISNT